MVCHITDPVMDGQPGSRSACMLCTAASWVNIRFCMMPRTGLSAQRYVRAEPDKRRGLGVLWRGCGLPVIALRARCSGPGPPAVTLRRAGHAAVRAVNPGGPHYPVAGDAGCGAAREPAERRCIRRHAGSSVLGERRGMPGRWRGWCLPGVRRLPDASPDAAVRPVPGDRTRPAA